MIHFNRDELETLTLKTETSALKTKTRPYSARTIQIRKFIQVTKSK